VIFDNLQLTPPEQRRRMTGFLPDSAVLGLYVTAPLGPILAENPGWRLRQWFAASVPFGPAAGMVVFDRGSVTTIRYSLFASGAVYNPNELLLRLQA
jgi:predicted MFS family arabinose efflux permease